MTSTPDGIRSRNAEALRVEKGQVREVEVYFGGRVSGSSPTEIDPSR